MILYLTDNNMIARELRDLVERDGSAVDDASARVVTLPGRLINAAAHVGRDVERAQPNVIAVAASAVLDEAVSEAQTVGVVYRLALAGDTWLPDVLFAHEEPALALHAGPAAEQGSQEDALEGTVSPAAAAAFAAAIALLGPGRVVMIAGTADAAGRIARRTREYGRETARQAAEAARRQDGGEATRETARLGDEIARRLRLTATQRARFLQRARSAAVRGGEVPPPVKDPVGPPSSKTEAKRRLAELERRLDEWKRAGL